MEAVIRFYVDQPSRGGLRMLFAAVVVVAIVVECFAVGLYDGCCWRLFLSLGGLFGGLGNLTTCGVLEADGLDDTDGDGLSHVTDSETSQRWELLEGLDAQWLRWDQDDNGGITGLDRFRVVLRRLAGTTIDLLLDFGEFASNVSGVAIQHGRVTVGDLAGVVQHDDLSGEVGSTLGGSVLGVTSDIATTQFLDRDVLNVEANVVSGHGFRQGFVVHLDGLDFSGQVDWGEHDDGTGLDDTGLHTTDWDCSDTTDFVHVLQGQTQGLVGRA